MRNPSLQVGPFRPNSQCLHMCYVGRNKALHGCTALVALGQHKNTVVAQFDDVRTGFGFGWWVFASGDFDDLS